MRLTIAVLTGLACAGYGRRLQRIEGSTRSNSSLVAELRHRKKSTRSERFREVTAVVPLLQAFNTAALVTMSSAGKSGRARAAILSGAAAESTLTVIVQAKGPFHAPPKGVYHLEVPKRVESVLDALRAAEFEPQIKWRHTMMKDVARTDEDALALLKLVHSEEHLRTVEGMSKGGGGGFDDDTYCAPGSWEAMLDGTKAWCEAVDVAAAGAGPAFALCRPAGHHAERDVAMGFGLVNFASAAVAAHLDAEPKSRVAILDWDVHFGNGVSNMFKNEPRVRYCSLHEIGGFPGTGLDESDRGPLGNLLHLPLPKNSGSEEYLSALREKALPFLLGDNDAKPDLILICSGYDALALDPLSTMLLQPADFAKSVRMIIDDFAWPPERIALGLEGGYSLDPEKGMPAAFIATCGALLQKR